MIRESSLPFVLPEEAKQAASWEIKQQLGNQRSLAVAIWHFGIFICFKPCLVVQFVASIWLPLISKHGSIFSMDIWLWVKHFLPEVFIFLKEWDEMPDFVYYLLLFFKMPDIYLFISDKNCSENSWDWIGSSVRCSCFWPKYSIPAKWRDQKNVHRKVNLIAGPTLVELKFWFCYAKWERSF